MDTVLCSSTHAVDVDDGRTVPPGQTLDNVDTTLPIAAALVASGGLVVLKPAHGHHAEEATTAPDDERPRAARRSREA